MTARHISDQITRLVVGEPRTITLGRPVRQARAIDAGSKALVWSQGKWQGSAGVGERLTELQAAWLKLCALARSRHPHVWGGAAGALLLVMAAAVTFTERGQGAGGDHTRSAPALPFAPPAAGSDHGVRVVAAPYEARAELGPPPTTPLPVAAPGEATDRRSVVLAPESRSPQQPTLERKTPAAAADGKRQDQPAKPPAVLLDEPPAGQGAAAKALPPSGAAAQKVDVKVAAPARGTGLIAITPDGKFAVFTNAKSRMPEQFKVGDLLPTGDTIRSIDIKDGKVVSSTKEYQLE